ncbi:MAG: glycosyltransferase family 4 protein [Tenuifilaceae bacterium]
MSKPQILLVSEAFPPEYSGAGQGAQFLAHSLLKRNMLFKIITRTKDKIANTNEPYFIEECKFSRIVFFQERLIQNTNNPFYKSVFLLLDFPLVFIKTTYIFFRNKNNIDVFFFVSTKWISLIMSFWCVLFKKKYVIETTLLGHDDPIVNSKKRHVWFKKIIKDFQFNNAVAITNISQLLATQCIKHGLSPNKIFTIPRSVSQEKFYRYKKENRDQLKKSLTKTEKGFPVILFVGVLIKRKGIDIVYETFKLILDKYPEAILVLAGPQGAPGEDLDVKIIKGDIMLRGLEKQVFFTGSVTNVENYYNIADIFFFPTRLEGFGRVFIEAMACGVPVVTKRIPGITDFIFEQEMNGLVIDSENPLEFAIAIEKVLKEKELSEKLSQNAITTIKARFSEDAVFKDYLKLIDFVLS